MNWQTCQHARARLASSRGRLLLAAVAILALGCGGSAVTEPGVSLLGTYDLRTLNDRAVPTTLSTGDTILSAVLVIYPDSNFVLTPSYHVIGQAPYSTTILGHVSLTRDSLSYINLPTGVIAFGRRTNGYVEVAPSFCTG